MTALSPGPWRFDGGSVLDAGGRELVSARYLGEHDGRAMASAHEALAVLEELAKDNAGLYEEYTAATGRAMPPVSAHAASWNDYYEWLGVRHHELRDKAAAVLEKAGVR